MPPRAAALRRARPGPSRPRRRPTRPATTGAGRRRRRGAGPRARGAPRQGGVAGAAREGPLRGLRGLVDLRLGGMRIHADKADVFEEKQPDGTVKRRLVAEGNVVFIRGEERLSGDRVEMDDDRPRVLRERRRLRRARGLRRGAAGRAGRRRHLPRRGREVHLLRSAQPALEVHRLERADRGRRQDRREERGLQGEGRARLLPADPLLPDQQRRPLDRASSSRTSATRRRGYEIGTGFFWAMGRSVDQTFYADYYSNLGFGFGHELRYASASPSRGTFRTYLFQLRARTSSFDPDTGELVGGRRRPRTTTSTGTRSRCSPAKVRALVRPQVQRPPLLPALQRQLQHGLVAGRSASRRAREGPQARRSVRLRRHDQHLLRHRLQARHRAAAGRLAAPLPAPGRLGQGRVRPRGDRGPAPVRRRQDDVDHWSRCDFAPTVSRPSR